MVLSGLIASTLLAGLVAAQKPGAAPEVHPKLKTWECTASGGCVEKKTAVVIDALSHWVHQKDNPSLGCGNWGSGPNKTVCPDEATCQENCIMEGVSDYASYGVYTDGGSLKMRLLRDDGSVSSPRLYLLGEGEKSYEMLKLTGREFTFDVDVSKLPCGTNGALYLSEMDKNGGQSKLNTGGAAYGTGYCDAQCFTTPFINGVVSFFATRLHPTAKFQNTDPRETG
jgi:cellulase